MNKPIIGLVTKHREVKARALTYVCDEMKDAIFANGGIAIGVVAPMKEILLVDKNNEKDIFTRINKLFTQKEKENLITQIKLCDGIILSGGKESDAYELFVAQYCNKNNIPIIGICAGFNNIVRAVGGKTKAVENPEIHKQAADYVHNVLINRNSKFYNFVKTTKFMVNSRHQNTIEDTACLTAVGYDDFGNIEVAEDKTKNCYIGIRFHPESLYQRDKIHNRIFKKFLEVCKKSRKK